MPSRMILLLEERRDPDDEARSARPAICVIMVGDVPHGVSLVLAVFACGLMAPHTDP